MNRKSRHLNRFFCRIWKSPIFQSYWKDTISYCFFWKWNGKAFTNEPCQWMSVRREPREFFFKWLFWSGGKLIKSVNLSCNVNLRLRFTRVNLEGQRPASQKKVPANLWDPDSLKLSAFAKESWLDAPHYHQKTTLCNIPIGLFFSHFVSAIKKSLNFWWTHETLNWRRT